MGFRHMVGLVAAVSILALTASPVTAILLFNNGVSSMNFSSFSFTGTATGNQFQFADNFALASSPTGWSVTGARWFGSLFDPVADDWLPTVGRSMVFDILVFEDAGGRPTGTPLDPVPGSAIAHRRFTWTGENYFGAGYEWVALYNTTFDPIVLRGETPYWLTIAARGDDLTWDEGDGTGYGWGWWGNSSLGQAANGHQGGHDFFSTWTDVDREQNFRLYGDVGPEMPEVPEPATFTMVGLFLAGLSARALRRRG